MSLTSTSLPKPKNWQDFERSTRELFASVLNDPNTQLNGRSGQEQYGIDIYGYRTPECLVGVQCKKKFENKINKKELRDEVEKAKKFRPRISEYFLITTAPRDQEIQKEARNITQELAKTDHPFLVCVWGWDDIEEHAGKYDAAWKAFDPTWNPYAEKANEELLVEVQKTQRILLEMTNRGWKTLSSIPSDETLNESDENTPRHGKITAFQRLIDDGHVNVALKQLLELKDEEWAIAARSERYRILVGIASAKLKLGEQEEAGNILLDAYNECSEHKRAKINRAKGLLLTKHYNEAAKLAKEILADDNSNADAAGTLIQSLIGNGSCVDPLSEIPESVIDTEEVLIAYIHFLRCKNNDDWLNVARTSASKYPESRILNLFKAEAVIDQTLRCDRDSITGGFLKNTTPQEIDAAIEILYSEAKEAIEKGISLLPSIAHNAALALRFSHDFLKAKKILEAAMKQHPSDENLKLQRAIVALLENKPSEVLSLQLEESTNPEAIGVLAEALDAIERNSDALALIENIDESKIPNHVKVGLLGVRTRAYIARGEKRRAVEDIKQRIADEPNNLDLRALQVNTYLKIDDNESAREAFEEALTSVDEQTSLALRLILSLDARKMGLDGAVVDLLKGRVATDRESEALRILMASSINSTSWVTAHETLDAIPESLRGKDWFLKADALLALNTGNMAAEKKVARYLEAFPHDIQMILARIGIWQQTGKDKEIRKLLRKLDLAALLGTPGQSIELARMIINYEKALTGLDYGYSVLMNNWNDPRAHLSYQALILSTEDIGTVIPSATAVAENTVVCLLIGGKERRYRIENKKHAFFEDERLDTGNELAAILIGKQPHAKFNIQNRIGSEPVEIAWIKPVYLDAFHCSLDQFNERFPRENGLQKFTFNPNAPDPLKNMRAVTKAQAETVQSILNDYQSRNIPLSFIGALVGKDPLDALNALPTAGVQFKVCRGNLPELEMAFDEIKRNAGAGCVLDAITLSIVRRFGVEESVKKICGPIYTTQSIIDLLALRYREAKENIKKAKGFVVWQHGQMLYREYSRDSFVEAARECWKELAWAKEVSSILPAVPKRDFKQDARKIIHIFDRFVTDPAVAADGSGLLLLSEDFGFRIWAAHTFELSTSWLQPVLITAEKDGYISADDYSETVNKLILSDHTYVSLNPNCLMHRARKDNFEVTPEFSNILGRVGGPSADISRNSLIMSQFIESVIIECKDDTKVGRIINESFNCFCRGRQEDIVDLVHLIISRIRLRKPLIIERALGWLLGHSIGMPYYNKLSQEYKKLVGFN